MPSINKPLTRVLILDSSSGEQIAFDLRGLGWFHLARAKSAREAEAMATMRQMGQEALKEISAMAKVEENPKPKDPVEELLEKYDRMILFQQAVASWSYDEPVSPETLQLIPTDVALELHKRILQICSPMEWAAATDTDGGADPTTDSIAR